MSLLLNSFFSEEKSNQNTSHELQWWERGFVGLRACRDAFWSGGTR